MSLNPAAHGEVSVERWHSEVPLLILCSMVSAGLWLLLAITIIGLAYALMLAAFFFVAHAVFVSYVKGNAVRIGPEQFPDLHAAVERLSRRVGLKEPPVAYVMESGGALNALATRFMRSNIIILFSDLLEACGDDLGARDMIIAHELGHIRLGHLRWHWFLLPSSIIPFLGAAHSRAREYSCDRYGVFGAGDKEGALHGLTILAAGGKLGRQVNRRALVRQRADLNTGWMTIGQWLSTHPSLADRVAALDPALRLEWQPNYAGPLRAVAIMGGIPMAITVLVVGAIFAGAQMFGGFNRLLGPDSAIASDSTSTDSALAELASLASADPAAATTKAETEMQRLANVALREHSRTGAFPASWPQLVSACQELGECTERPTDPFDGQAYGYDSTDTYFTLFSSGPDAEPMSDDDIVYDSRVGQLTRRGQMSARER